MAGRVELRPLYHNLTAVTVVAAVLLAVAASAAVGSSLPPAHQPAARTRIASAMRARIVSLYGRLPLSFEANRGQSDRRVKFLSRGADYSLFLTSTQAVLLLRKGQKENGRKTDLRARGKSDGMAGYAVLRIGLVGASDNAQVIGVDRLGGKANYFIGNDPKAWHVGIPTYARVKYTGVYRGVNLVYCGTQGRLEYDFTLSPGADPKEIQLDFAGASKLRVDKRGNLVVELGGAELVERAPRIYQEIDGKRYAVAGGYELEGDHTVGFKLHTYDPNRPLVIDPVLAYSTYLGGSGADQGNGIAVDSSGDAYVIGFTNSGNFPTTKGADQTTLGRGSYDAFVAKLNRAGTALVYSTYFGGSSDDEGYGIAVDSSGNAYVTGYTSSTNFPTTKGAYRTKLSGYYDAFAAKLSSTGALVYSTLLGGSDYDQGNGIAVDSSGNAYVTGYTNSSNFPITKGAYQTAYGGNIDAFVAKLNSTGTALVYSTYLGGKSSDFSGGIAVDSSGNAYVTGLTKSGNFPATPGAYQTAYGGGSDAFVAKLNSTGTALVYSTYLGGSGYDEGYGIAVGSSGNAYVTGFTKSGNLPTTKGAYQTTSRGGTDVFVTKLNRSGAGLVYSTYLGGKSNDFGYGIVVDPSGNSYVTGVTSSSNFPTTGAFQARFGGGRYDAFVTKLNRSGAGLVYSTYLGGRSEDEGYGIALDSSGNAYITGITKSDNFPATKGTYQSKSGGGTDAFVAKIKPTRSGSPQSQGRAGLAR